MSAHWPVNSWKVLSLDFLLDSLGERDYIFLGYLGDSASMDVMAEIRQSRPEEL